MPNKIKKSRCTFLHFTGKVFIWFPVCLTQARVFRIRNVLVRTGSGYGFYSLVVSRANFINNCSKPFLFISYSRYIHVHFWSCVVDPDPERHHFDGSKSGSASRACRSVFGSGAVSISTKCNAKPYFLRKFLYTFKILKIVTYMTLLSLIFTF